MRAPDEATQSRRRRKLSRRGRIVAASVLGALGALFLSLRGIAAFYTDYLWYDSLSLSSVWSTLLGARIFLGVLFTTGFFLLMYANLYMADRLAPRFRPSGPEEELLERYFEVVGRRTGMVRAAVALLFALIAGAGVSQEWNSWLLFINRVDFGETDPLYGRDIGFYVFQMPFLTFVVSWLFAALVIILIVTTVAHYLNGGIRLQTTGERVTPQVKVHLSVILAMLALTRAAGYFLRRYELTVSERGFVTGAGYTDVHAQLPAVMLLLFISLFSCLLFLYNIRRRGWVLPVLAVGLWGFVSVAAGSAYPWVVQRFRVEPAESTREAPYIEDNINATRRAYGLDQVVVAPFDASQDLSAEDLTTDAAQATLDNLRLLDPEIVNDVFQKREGDVGWLRFPDSLDVDRYLVDGKLTQVLVGARELSQRNLPAKTWESQRLLYTHGYGLAMAPANKTKDQEPDFIMSGLPQQSDPSIGGIDGERARLYYSEDLTGYAITTKEGRAEIGYLNDSFHYDGQGGVGIGGFVRRAAFALRFGEVDSLISSFIDDESKIHFVRGVRERVNKVAPFLALDSDPYPVVLNGRVYYVVDAYTSTNRYPYSERLANAQLPPGSGLNHQLNYVRNSVKAVVDAYDGTVELYLWPGPTGEIDPIARAYSRAFPKLFSSADEMPEGMIEHLRHPEDLFRAQTTMYARYHVGDPGVFYSQTQRWAVAQQPPRDPNGATVRQTVNVATGEVVQQAEERISPEYVLMTLPGEPEPEYVSIRSFVPVSQNDEKRELTAFMVAKTDGSLLNYTISSADVPGPSLVSSNAQSDNVISQKVTLLSQRGSKVQFGNLLLAPVNKSIVWVLPLYVSADSDVAVSRLNSVIVASGQRIVEGDTLDEALLKLVNAPSGPGEPSPATGSGDEEPPANGDDKPDTTLTTESDSSPGTTAPSPPSSGAATVQSLASEAVRLFEEADVALKASDLATYQTKVNEAREKVAA
ncbi:MAG: UPF0182 family protein, partial [Acidimicrobiia bacterium]|nr:UPF0182 family protein [Acidimicrobiia bacterium]